MWRDPGLRTVLILAVAMTTLAWLWLEASLDWEQRRMAEAASPKQVAASHQNLNRESVALISARARRGETAQKPSDSQRVAVR